MFFISLKALTKSIIIPIVQMREKKKNQTNPRKTHTSEKEK